MNESAKRVIEKIISVVNKTPTGYIIIHCHISEDDLYHLENLLYNDANDFGKIEDM